MRSVVVFLTHTPHIETLNFAQSVQEETEFDVFVVIDNNDFVCRDCNSFSVIKINDELCKENGYHGVNISDNTTHIKKSPIAFDKFLYYFCDINTEYDFVWCFEDDVFIPSVDHIKNLHSKYSDNDLVTANNFHKNDNLLDWHWRHIFEKIQKPHYYSMSCAVGISKKLLQKIKCYVDENKCLFHLEAMLNTIAMQNNLKVCTPLELKSIVWQGKWDIDEFLLLPNSLFHPVKDIENYPCLRGKIVGCKKTKYKPKNTLPDFIKELL